MNREQILAEIKRAFEANSNVALGERVFFARTKLNRTVLRRAGFPNYGAACEAAGFKRNQLKQAYGDDQLFAPIARLAREVGHCPTTGERAVIRYKDSSFPGESAISRRAKVEPLAPALLRWCRNHPAFEDVAQMLEGTAPLRGNNPTVASGSRKVVNGYVYFDVVRGTWEGLQGRAQRECAASTIPNRHGVTERREDRSFHRD